MSNIGLSGRLSASLGNSRSSPLVSTPHSLKPLFNCCYRFLDVTSRTQTLTYYRHYCEKSSGFTFCLGVSAHLGPYTIQSSFSNHKLSSSYLCINPAYAAKIPILPIRTDVLYRSHASSRHTPVLRPAGKKAEMGKPPRP